MIQLTKNLVETGLDELELVGGKNASLGEMLKNLCLLGVQVPNGFVVTSQAYDLFIKHNNLDKKISDIIHTTNIDDLVELRRNSMKIRTLIIDGEYPQSLKLEILDRYHTLSKNYRDNEGNIQEYTDVAVRSSGTSEDLPDASFAGQQDTYLNVRGNSQLLDKVKACFASLYTDRAICYRKTFNFGNENNIKLAVCIQKMVRSDLGASGVAFSLDPDSGYKNITVINSSWGLGEMVVSGQVKPDEYIVFKPTLELGYSSIIDKKLGEKTKKMVYGDETDRRTKIVNVDLHKQNQFSLRDEDVLKLAKWVSIIENYYTKKYNRWCPVDVEWAFCGQTRELYIVQARPETIHSRKINKNEYVEYFLNEKISEDNIITRGIAVGSKINYGKVKKVFSLDTREGDEPFQEGDVLVTEYTDPTYEPLMKIASAIITNKGGRTSHAAIVSRELGKVAIVGCENATDILENGQFVTADCSQGDTGFVYNGKFEYRSQKTDLDTLHPLTIDTKLMLNIGNPESVYHLANLPVHGVGLAREEFIIGSSISVHPLAILNYGTLEHKLKEKIREKIRGFDSPVSYYINKLAYGIARIASAFYPRSVIVRFSDFKSNEYRELLGGDLYEPVEENPMLGFRGCSRYYSSFFKDAFELECKAIKLVREVMGLTNVIVMLPFCRTVKECELTLDTMKEFGLERGKNELQVYLMCEIPSNVILASEFCKYVDGFSIGSNDLTQLSLGLDRDAGNLNHIGNETDETVKKLISKAIKTCKKNGVKIGICGQGPSDIPEFAKFLVDQGIDTISLVPDSIFKTHIMLSNNFL